MKCEKCGSELVEGSQSCNKCGTKVKSSIVKSKAQKTILDLFTLLPFIVGIALWQGPKYNLFEWQYSLLTTFIIWLLITIACAVIIMIFTSYEPEILILVLVVVIFFIVLMTYTVILTAGVDTSKDTVKINGASQSLVPYLIVSLILSLITIYIAAIILGRVMSFITSLLNYIKRTILKI